MSDFAWEADEIERNLKGLSLRCMSVVRQLRAGTLIGEEDPELVSMRAKSLSESLLRANTAICKELARRRGESK